MHRVHIRLSLAIVLWASPVIAQSPNAANNLSAKMPLPTAADLADRCAKASGGFTLVGSSDDGRTALAKTLETVHFDTPRSQATSSLKVDSSVP